MRGFALLGLMGMLVAGCGDADAVDARTGLAGPEAVAVCDQDCQYTGCNYHDPFGEQLYDGCVRGCLYDMANYCGAHWAEFIESDCGRTESGVAAREDYRLCVMALNATCSECAPGTVVEEACRGGQRSDCVDAQVGCSRSGGDCNADFVLEACAVYADAGILEFLECTVEECTEATKAYLAENEFFGPDPLPACVVYP